jgi:hypothetical protein
MSRAPVHFPPVGCSFALRVKDSSLDARPVLTTSWGWRHRPGSARAQPRRARGCAGSIRRPRSRHEGPWDRQGAVGGGLGLSSPAGGPAHPGSWPPRFPSGPGAPGQVGVGGRSQRRKEEGPEVVLRAFRWIDRSRRSRPRYPSDSHDPARRSTAARAATWSRNRAPRG